MVANFRTGGVQDTAGGGWLARDSANTSETPNQHWNFAPWGYAYGGRMNMGLGGFLGDGSAQAGTLVDDVKRIVSDMPWWGWIVAYVVVKKVL